MYKCTREWISVCIYVCTCQSDMILSLLILFIGKHWPVFNVQTETSRKRLQGLVPVIDTEIIENYSKRDVRAYSYEFVM